MHNLADNSSKVLEIFQSICTKTKTNINPNWNTRNCIALSLKTDLSTRKENHKKTIFWKNCASLQIETTETHLLLD